MRLVSVALILFACGCATVPYSGPAGTPPSPRDYDAAKSEVFVKAQAAMLDRGWILEHADESAGTLRARAATGDRSWGDLLTIKVIPLSALRTRVSLDARENSELIDWSRNAQNVADFYAALERQLAGIPPPKPPEPGEEATPAAAP